MPQTIYAQLLHWPMAGHDIERSSRAGETVHTPAKNPRWFKTIPEFIPSETHVVTYPGSGARPGLIFVATSGGVYALRETDGSTFWFYQTTMPVGHSPTIVGNTAYISVFDKTIHAVNIDTGTLIWQSNTAGAGFDTSPLITQNVVYAGNRDGYMYALNASDGSLKWSFKTGGRISYSAAFQNNVLYFASNDSHAYALNATTGAQIWKSAKLPGEGFYSYWPVIAENTVIFSGSSTYRTIVNMHLLGDIIAPYLPRNDKPAGVDPDAQGWHDASTTISRHFADKPHLRTVFVLDKSTGQELTTPYPPVIYKGNSSGVRQPPAVGSDGLIYFNAPSRNDLTAYWLQGGFIAWKPGTALIKPLINSDSGDELDSGSIIGNYFYWNHKEDQAGGVENIANIQTGAVTKITTWIFSSLKTYFPNYQGNWDKRKYGSVASNGYGTHGYSNPPVPLGNNVYFHRSNAVVSFGP